MNIILEEWEEKIWKLITSIFPNGNHGDYIDYMDADHVVIDGTYDLTQLADGITALLTLTKQRERESTERELLEDLLNCLPLRSDWDDDVKVTFQMGINVVRENLEERLQALTHEDRDSKQTP